VARRVQKRRAVQVSQTQGFAQAGSRISREMGDFRIVAECHAADARRGGDFYYASLGQQGRLAVVIGDACGRGSEGARLLTHLLPAIHALVRPGSGPARLLAELNRRVAIGVPIDRFVTAAALEIDAAAGVMLVANAGHVPPLVRRARGGVSLIGRASGPPLGLLRDAHYTEERVGIERGDMLVFMTDGVVEAVESDLVNMSHLRSTIARAPGGRVHSSVGRLLADSASEADDRTLVSLELCPEPRDLEPS
jgi:serine phosphatase RsbU (regulator of sigma subunit)